MEIIYVKNVRSTGFDYDWELRFFPENEIESDCFLVARFNEQKKCFYSFDYFEKLEGNAGYEIYAINKELIKINLEHFDMILMFDENRIKSLTKEIENKINIIKRDLGNIGDYSEEFSNKNEHQILFIKRLLKDVLKFLNEIGEKNG